MWLDKHSQKHRIMKKIDLFITVIIRFSVVNVLYLKFIKMRGKNVIT